jgi:gas vesicle protein GvpN
MNGDDGSRALATTVRAQTDEDNILPEPSEEFVWTPYVRELTERALAYLEVGYAVHFAGPAGTGKTTLAFHVAAQLGRPVTLIHGDDEFGSSDLIGHDAGYRKHRLIDNFIHSVLKTEEEMKSLWVDQRLTTACRNGDTLIYDEFTRSRPEANNVLLSILEEKILTLPKLRTTGEAYLEVHPQFRAIFTSNPEEYAGTHKTQDALMDRLITIPLGHYDRETEIQITMAKSGIARPDAERIVDIVRELRAVGVNNHRPTIRACIAIARILARRGGSADAEDPVFKWVSRDVLSVDTAKVTRGGQSLMLQKVDEIIRKVCGQRPRTAGDTDQVMEER